MEATGTHARDLSPLSIRLVCELTHPLDVFVLLPQIRGYVCSFLARESGHRAFPRLDVLGSHVCRRPLSGCYHFGVIASRGTGNLEEILVYGADGNRLTWCYIPLGGRWPRRRALSRASLFLLTEQMEYELWMENELWILKPMMG